MTSKDCSLLCFCSNRNRLAASEFSNMLSGLTSPQSDQTEFGRTLMEKGVFGYRAYHIKRKLTLGFGFYLIKSKEGLISAFTDLKKKHPKTYSRNIETVQVMSNFATKYPSFSISLNISSGEEFGLTDFSRMPRFINSALSLINKVKPEKLVVQECAAFLFKKEETKLAGGLNLPMALHLEKELSERTGEARIEGLELHFQKSPISLRDIAFSLRKDDLLMRIVALPLFSISTQTPRNVYEHAHELANLFLKKEGEVKQSA